MLRDARCRFEYLKRYSVLHLRFNFVHFLLNTKNPHTNYKTKTIKTQIRWCTCAKILFVVMTYLVSLVDTINKLLRWGVPGETNSG